MCCTKEGFSTSFKMIFSDEVLLQMNWDGRNQKTGIGGLKLIKNILFGINFEKLNFYIFKDKFVNLYLRFFFFFFLGALSSNYEFHEFKKQIQNEIKLCHNRHNQLKYINHKRQKTEEADYDVESLE